MEFAISIENLSKRYRLGVIGTGTLTHDLNRWWAGVRGKEDPFQKIGMENRLNESGGEYVWAIDNINLNIKQGEILGIIGKNGAGKSTLLKLLSRVTSPTSGTIKMHGRVASLLEVGTGFHPELTGRENVFLNGAILGMTKNEIKLKFDEIVDFSGIGKYIDTPVKRYSSGMYVRLAFAVAAHLDPEILIVDEVLAVGDAEFQKKAIGKMQEVSQGKGRTVLFVSHNMGSIQNLCNKVILVSNGKLLFEGDPQEAINKYLQNTVNLKSKSTGLQSQYRKGHGDIRFLDLSILKNEIVKTGSGLEISIKMINNSDSAIRNVRIDVGIDNSQGIRVAHLSNQTINKTISLLPKIITEEIFIVEDLPFVAGRYGLTLYCEAAGQVQDWISNAFFFDIENSDFYNTGKLPPEGQGNILLRYKIEQV